MKKPKIKQRLILPQRERLSANSILGDNLDFNSITGVDVSLGSRDENFLQNGHGPVQGDGSRGHILLILQTDLSKEKS
jgi:hypothetical protein